jgi:hypothetical protein
MVAFEPTRASESELNRREVSYISTKGRRNSHKLLIAGTAVHQQVPSRTLFLAHMEQLSRGDDREALAEKVLSQVKCRSFGLCSNPDFDDPRGTTQRFVMEYNERGVGSREQ